MESFKMNWNGKRVLITGAGGFIGSHLTETLTRMGARTKGFVHYNSNGTRGWLEESEYSNDIEIVSGDIRDVETVNAAMSDIDIVFHLAALIAIPYSLVAPRSYLETNIGGTVNVLQSARQSEIELLVHTSSSEVYGTATYTPIDEHHPLQGQSPYSASKIAADKMVESYNLSYGLPVATLRPFNTYGPRQLSRAVIPTIISQALTQDSIKLGNLSPTRDFNYVLDTVQGFVKIAEHTESVGKLYNIGSGTEISIREVVEKVCQLLGREPLDVIQEIDRTRPDGGEVERLCADASASKNILDWEPEYEFEKGLKLTIDWIEENLDRYRPNRYAK